MRIPTRDRHVSLAFNMTPMIDVVFQLIIFFLVSSHLVKQEARMELPLPIADSGTLADEDASRSVINVRADGALLVAGRVIPAEQIRERLRAWRSEKGEFELRIRADRDTSFRFVEPILLACYREGVSNVVYSVFRSKDAR
ncbi:MAG: biopolymer transporter ExbD [Planctomycetes bacterium]|nr:biopolymer transporter ExbD [Planctomycetota bacterium]